MEPIHALLILLAVVTLGVFIYGRIIPLFQKWKEMKDTIKRHNDTYLQKSGGTSLYFPPGWNKIRDGKAFNYSLSSFDGGKNWYVVDKEKLFDEIVILGNVEDIYPGLMERLDGFDNLSEHLSKNGPLDVTNSDDLKVLNKAGFSVSTKSK